MNIDDLFRKLRQHGLHSEEAAATLGFALLVRQVSWDGIAVSHRRRRKIERTLAKMGVNLHDIHCEAAGPENEPARHWNTEGVLHSGKIA